MLMAFLNLSEVLEGSGHHLPFLNLDMALAPMLQAAAPLHPQGLCQLGIGMWSWICSSYLQRRSCDRYLLSVRALWRGRIM